MTTLAPIGFHGLHTDIHKYLGVFDAAGVPFVAKVVDKPGDAVVLCKSYTKAAHTIILRYTKWPGQADDHPNLKNEPTIEARWHWQKVRQLLEQEPRLEQYKHRLWLELVNEVHAMHAPWLATFCVELATVANADGYRVLLPAFNAGQPEPEQWAGDFAPYLRYCAAHWDKAGISLHEGKTGPAFGDYDDPITNFVPWMVGRVQFLSSACEQLHTTMPQTVVSEWAWGAQVMPGIEQALREAQQLASLYGQWPNVIGVCLWTLHQGQHFGDLRDKLQKLIVPLSEWYEGVMPDVHRGPVKPTEPPVEPPPTPPTGNLLHNGSFEGAWHHPGDIPELQIPDGWRFWYAGPETPNPISGDEWNKWARPEVRVLPRHLLPEPERDTFILDGDNTLKPFKGRGAWWGGFEQIVDLEPGRYKLTIRVYGDLVSEWDDGGGKVWAPDPMSGRVKINEGQWQFCTPGQWNEYTLVWQHDGDDNALIQVDFMAPHALANSGFFCDMWELIMVDDLEPGDPVEPKPKPPRVTRIVDLVTQDVTREQFMHVADAKTLPTKGTITHSHDDAGTMVATGLRESSYVRVWGDRPPSDLVALTDIYGVAWETWPYPGEPEPPPPPVEPPEVYDINDIVNDLTRHATKRYSERSLSAITTVAVHHTVSPPDRSIDSLAAYHVNSRGWPGIGYHYVVTDFGRIFLTNYIESVSYHVGNPNTYTVGIALQGNFTDHPPPQAQQDAARWLVSFLKGYLKKDLDVRGHRHMPGASTQCPGNTLDSWLPYVIGDDYEPPPPEPPQPTTYDLAYYMAAFLDSNGPLYEVQTLGGGQERHQTQTASGGMFWHTKNRNWEELSVSDTYILRGTDTSQSGTTYYTLRDGGTYWSEWAPREMVIGEVFGRDPIVAVYRKRDCSIVSQGAQESWLRLDAIHSTWTSPAAAGIQLDDVMQLSWLATPDPDSWIERYFYAAGYGLVGWQSRTTTAGISEIHPKGSRPDNQRMVIGCLDRS